MTAEAGDAKLAGSAKLTLGACSETVEMGGDLPVRRPGWRGETGRSILDKGWPGAEWRVPDDGKAKRTSKRRV